MQVKRNDEHWVSETAPRQWSKVGRGRAKWQIKIIDANLGVNGIAC